MVTGDIMPLHQTNGPNEIAQIFIGAKCDRKTGTFEFSIIIGFRFLILFKSFLNIYPAPLTTAFLAVAATAATATMA